MRHTMRRGLAVVLAAMWVFIGTAVAGTDQETPSYLNTGLTDPAAWDIRVDEDTTYQTVKSFGTSWCWIDKDAANLSEETIDELVKLFYDPEEGIGLTSFRYNIGAGGPVNQVDGWNGRGLTQCVEVEPGVYDLERDGVALSILRKAVAAGATTVTAFANSPPARMTKSGLTGGNTDGTSNLDPAYIEEFATYLVDIVELLRAEGIPVDYLSPINEPQWEWGKVEVDDEGVITKQATQEGCHYEPAEVVTVGRAVLQELLNRNSSVKLSLAESAQWDHPTHSYGLYTQLISDPLLAAHLDHFAAHSYGDHMDAVRRTNFYNYIQRTSLPLPLVQTEFCSALTGVGGMLQLARVLHEDLTCLSVEAWDFWSAISTDTWCLVQMVKGQPVPSDRYYALGNYAKFVTGHTRVAADVAGDGTVYASAYLSPELDTTTLVVVNEGETAQNVSFEGQSGTVASVYTTNAAHHLEYSGEMSAEFAYTLPAQSVTTVVFHNDVYTVTFDAGDGVTVEAQRLLPGRTANEPLPVRDGYVLDTWQTTTGTAFDFARPVTDDVILTATWRLRGDVTGDGDVSISDVRQVLRVAVGKTTLIGASQRAADVDDNGRVTVADVRKILRRAVGKVDTL